MDRFRLTHEGEVAVLTFDDGKANALAAAEFEELARRLDEASSAGALLMLGRPGYFSAGLNLKVLPTLTGPEIAVVIRRFGEAMEKLFMFPRPSVAAIGGHALGAGAMFAFGCDVRIAAAGAFRFGLNEVPGGLMIPTFGTEIARAVVPLEQQAEVILHGRVMAPEELLSRGLVEAVVDVSSLQATALARATALAALPSAAYAATKRNLRADGLERMRARLDAEVKHVETVLTGNGGW